MENMEYMYGDFPNIITYYNTLHKMNIYDIQNGNDYLEAIVVRFDSIAIPHNQTHQNYGSK